ncbi:MAG: hypothetical protein NVSMB48_22690 [Marmoricola sp.]
MAGLVEGRCPALRQRVGRDRADLARDSKALRGSVGQVGDAGAKTNPGHQHLVGDGGRNRSGRQSASQTLTYGDADAGPQITGAIGRGEIETAGAVTAEPPHGVRGAVSPEPEA